MEKKIEDYLHLYLGCEVKHPYATGILRMVTKDNSCKIGNSDGFWDIQRCKPLLRPLSSMTEEDFYSFLESKVTEKEILLKATINNMWTGGFYDKKEYQERIDEELPIDDVSLLYDLEEADYNNVISVGKRGGDLAYGCNDEMRYFAEISLMSEWINHLRKRGIDVDGLIESGLAIDKTKH